MESLFENIFTNNQPLRKFEPLIRFDIDGNPQPRRHFNGIQSKIEIKVDVKKVSEPSMPAVLNPETTKSRQEELKRKVSPSSGASGPEPKKKQQTQTKIMSFFTKKSS